MAEWKKIITDQDVYFTTSSQTDTAYTLTASDAFGYIVATNSSSITITVPDITWPTDTEILIEQRGTGQITIQGASGVTVNSSQTLKSSGQYAVIGLKRTAANTWTLTGDREAS